MRRRAIRARRPRGRRRARPPAELVAEAARGEQQAREHERVRVADPLQLALRARRARARSSAARRRRSCRRCRRSAAPRQSTERIAQRRAVDAVRDAVVELVRSHGRSGHHRSLRCWIREVCPPERPAATVTAIRSRCARCSGGVPRPAQYGAPVSFDAVEAAFDAFAEADPTYSAQLSVHVGADARRRPRRRRLEPTRCCPCTRAARARPRCHRAARRPRPASISTPRSRRTGPSSRQAGKAAVTVRQLLSHQAGLPGVDGGFSWDELLDHDALADATRGAAAVLAAGRRRSCTTPSRSGRWPTSWCAGSTAGRVAEVLRDEVTGPARHRRLDGHCPRRRTPGSSTRCRRRPRS